ncbi:hypothetical protein D3C86_1391900 [compost metagenome]
MRNGQSQQLDLHAHGLGQGHRGDQFGTTALANLGGADRAGPDRGADLEARIERFPVFGAAVHLERLLGYPPAAALRSPGRGQKAIDHAFQGVALGAETLRVEFLDVLPGLGIERPPGDLAGILVDDFPNRLEPPC